MKTIFVTSTNNKRLKKLIFSMTKLTLVESLLAAFEPKCLSHLARWNSLTQICRPLSTQCCTEYPSTGTPHPAPSHSVCLAVAVKHSKINFT